MLELKRWSVGKGVGEERKREMGEKVVMVEGEGGEGNERGLSSFISFPSLRVEDAPVFLFSFNHDSKSCLLHM